MKHQHEEWQMLDSARGGRYCGACGEHEDEAPAQVIPDEAVEAYLKAHFRPDTAAELLAAAQPLMAIAWDEGWDAFAHFDARPGGPYPANPYRIAK